MKANFHHFFAKRQQGKVKVCPGDFSQRTRTSEPASFTLSTITGSIVHELTSDMKLALSPGRNPQDPPTVCVLRVLRFLWLRLRFEKLLLDFLRRRELI